MGSSSSQPERAQRKDRKVPLGVIAVALYQLAKVAFFAWVFAQCWEARGTGIPPFGDVAAHNPMFETPLFLLFAVLAVCHLVLAVGLSSLGAWARTCSWLLLFTGVLYWFFGHVFGYTTLLIPVENSKILSAVFLEVLAMAILYVPAQVREAFVPPHPSDRGAGMHR
jgi:hypothetical protein